MVRVVLDTNIVVSALMSSKGNSARILDMLADQKLRICYNQEILTEYLDVLSRSHFNFDARDRDDFIQGVKQFGLLVHPNVSNIQLPDEADRCFYDVAILCEAILITGNTKHYPIQPFIVTPAEFVILHEHLLSKPPEGAAQ